MKDKKTLLVLPANPLEAYIHKGTIDKYKRYFNPGHFFDSFIAVYVHTKTERKSVEGIAVSTIASRFFLLDYLRLIAECIRLCKIRNVSVIRAYCAELPGLTAIIVGLLMRVPTVVSVHSFIDTYMKGRGFGMHWRLAVSLVHRIVYRFCTQIWCVGDGLAYDLEKIGVKKEKMRIIYNKVATSRFRNADRFRRAMRMRYNIEQDDIVLIHVGRLSADKRLREIVQGLYEIRRLSLQARLVIIGSSTEPKTSGVRAIGHGRYEPIRDDLVKLAESLNIQNNVLFLGRVSEDELPQILGMADIYVNASIGEGFGIAIAEAMAAGLPVVATHELMYLNRGMVVNPNAAATYRMAHPDELAKAVYRIAKDPNLRDRLSRGAVKEASKYDWKKMEKLEADSYNNLFMK